MFLTAGFVLLFTSVLRLRKVWETWIEISINYAIATLTGFIFDPVLYFNTGKGTF